MLLVLKRSPPTLLKTVMIPCVVSDTAVVLFEEKRHGQDAIIL